MPEEFYTYLGVFFFFFFFGFVYQEREWCCCCCGKRKNDGYRSPSKDDESNPLLKKDK